MNWPTAITICVCAICATLLAIGGISNSNKNKNDQQ